MKPLLFLVFSLCAFAQIEHPQIGVMLDEHGDVRAVLGVAESATTSEPLWKGVLSLACTSRICFAKTESALLSSSGEIMDAPAGPAMLAIDGDTVYAYFAEAHQLSRWHDGQLEALDFAPDGEVLDLRATGSGLEYAVRRADGVWAGNRYLGDATAVLFLDGGRVLLASAERIRLLLPDGSETDFPVTGVRAFIRMSDGYVQMITSGGMWALRTDPGQEQIFLLPGPGSQE